MRRAVRVIHKPRAKWYGAKGERLRALLSAVVDDESEDPGVRLMARSQRAEVDRQRATAGDWRFVMVEGEMNWEVVNWLSTTSRRPVKALRLWAICLREIQFESGRIGRTRAELAAEVGVSPRDLSKLMRELMDCFAVDDDQEGRRGRAASWRVSPHVAWHGSGTARKVAAASWPELKVIDGGGRRNERRSRAAVAVPLV